MKKKKTMKSALFTRLTLLCLLVGSFGSSAIAQAQTVDYGYQQNTQLDSYSVWCDEVTRNLMQAQALGWNLYHRQMYTQAKTQIMIALQNALGSMNIPGGAFRPATYREIMRTVALINALEHTNSNFPGGNNPVLKAKTIAYVALQRISFIAYVKDAVDISYHIPCRRGCGGAGYENPAYESAIAAAAAEQLSRAQNYSSVVGADGMVYPINDTPYYMTIVSMAAQWAAEDLSTCLFSKVFSCAILNLRTLGARASAYQAMLGDVSAVQEIHLMVRGLVAEMSYRPYGCGYRF